MSVVLNPFTGKFDFTKSKAELDLLYLLLDGSNNLTGADSWLTQSAGDARYLLSSTGTVYDVSTTKNVTTSGLSVSDFNSYTIVKVQGNGGAVTVTGTPSIDKANYDGYLLILLGMSDTNTVTFQDGSKLDGSGLTLNSGQNITLGKGDTLHLIYEASLDNWIEVSRSNNVYTAPITAYLLFEDDTIFYFEDDTEFEEE